MAGWYRTPSGGIVWVLTPRDRRDRFVSERLPRWINRIYAFLTGRFWLPCPRCGRGFGAHECGSGAEPYPGREPGAPARAVCVRCAPPEGWGDPPAEARP